MAVRRPHALLGFALALGGGVPRPACADLWADLWLRPDQKGDRVLARGHAAEAAKLYDDPRRRGYAELQAGQWAAAARDLEPFRDPLAEYDRGNALVRQGQLKPALDAYDHALAGTAAGSVLARDARHNRDLVAKALERQSPQQGNGQGGGGQSGRSGQPPPQPRPDGGAHDAPGQSGQNFSGMNQSAEQEGASGRNGLGQANASPGGPTDAEPRAGKGSAGEPNAGRGTAAQAEARGAQGDGSPGEHGAAPQTAAPRPPESEQSMAREQWLRQIPDDPAGLLRRKFMIEHLLHEQEGRP